MTAYKPKGKRTRKVKMPTRDGRKWVARSTGTRDPQRAKIAQRMVDVLGPKDKAAWDLLELVTAVKPSHTLAELLDLWLSTPVTRHDTHGRLIAPSEDERLAHVRQLLKDVNVEPMVEDFFTYLKSPKYNIALDTAKHYVSAVRRLVEPGAPFPLSRLNERELNVWLEEMDDVSPSTVRKRGIGMGVFIDFLRGKQILRHDPMAEITLPAQDDPHAHYIETADVIRLGDAAPGVYRLYEYALAGTALEVSTALSIRVRSVSRLERKILAPGTKTYNRNRFVRVADYAWDAILEALKGKHPDSRLFEEIPDRWDAGEVHTDTRDALIAKGFRTYAEMPDGRPHLYTLRDHRHTWAVRALASGWSIESVRRQLGHANGILANKVYGIHVARQEDIDRYEKMATERDAAIAAAAKLEEESA